MSSFRFACSLVAQLSVPSVRVSTQNDKRLKVTKFNSSKLPPKLETVHHRVEVRGRIGRQTAISHPLPDEAHQPIKVWTVINFEVRLTHCGVQDPGPWSFTYLESNPGHLYLPSIWTPALHAPSLSTIHAVHDVHKKTYGVKKELKDTNYGCAAVSFRFSIH